MRFSINTDRVKNIIFELDSIEGELNNITSGIADVINVQTVQTDSLVQVLKTLKRYQQNVRTVSRQTSLMREGLGDILDEYRSHEQVIYEHAAHIRGNYGNRVGMTHPIRTLWPFIFPPFVLTPPVIWPSMGEIGASIWGTILGRGYNESSDGGFSWSMLGGESSVHTDVGGMDVGYDGKFHVGHLEAKNSSGASWDVKSGDVHAEFGGKVSFSGVDGEISGNIGAGKGTLEGSIGNASAQGSIGLTLFSGGQFAPAIYGEAKAKANVAQGKVSGQIGEDDSNVHVAAEGTLLGAEAEAKFQAGKIVEEDGTVNYGVEGKVGAEAYVAEGSVSGGFTLFGIKIDATVDGKAGGAGAKAGGKVTGGAAEGELGLGLGLGVGVKIKIDWTNFKWPW